MAICEIAFTATFAVLVASIARSIYLQHKVIRLKTRIKDLAQRNDRLTSELFHSQRSQGRPTTWPVFARRIAPQPDAKSRHAATNQP